MIPHRLGELLADSSGWSGTGEGSGAPDPPPHAPPGVDALAETVIGWLKWGALVAGMIGILICAGMIIIGRRRHSGLAQEGLIGSAWVLGGLALASTAALLVGAFASVGSP